MSTASQGSTVVARARGCLYRSQAERRSTLTKQVSFPEDDSRLVTGFMEAPNPWEYAEDVDRGKIISAYSESCVKHGHRPSSSILKQLEAIDISGDRSSYLDLKGELLDASRCESLEEILKRVQFVTLCLEDTSLDDEGAVAVFDMVEYYESANHINISSNQGIAARGWQACSRMIKKTQCLEQLEARNMLLNEQIMPILSRSLRITPHLQVLKLENCKLTGRPVTILVGALKLNTGLKELYLADNDLGITDALQLAALLRSNTTLQLLDISNNSIQDIGAGHMVDALTEQPMTGEGLSILVLWNNRLTRNSSSHFARVLANSRSLEMLNIGHNVLTNEVLHVMKDSLQQNRSLLRLGMQSTHLTCEGAIVLAEVIEDNRVVQRIDLRDNAIMVAGLMALSLSMKSNQSVTQLDLDDTPKRKSHDFSLGEYRRLVSEIRGYCKRNEEIPQPELDEEEDDISEVSDSERSDRRVRLSSVNSRKISLTCQTLLQSVVNDYGSSADGLLAEPRRSGGRLRSPAPSPVPSPVSSPMPSPAPSPGPARSRFRVSQVSESDSLSPSPSASPSSSPTCFFPTSRFKVTVVEPPSPVVACNSVTMGFTCFQTGNNGSGKESVTPDTDNEVQNIMSGAQSSVSPANPPSTNQAQKVQEVEAVPHQAQQQQVPQPQAQSQPSQANRSRKISWVPMGISSVSLSASDDKAPSSLERLLGLFQNPGSLFNKSPTPQAACPTNQPQRQSPQSSPQQQRGNQTNRQPSQLSPQQQRANQGQRQSPQSSPQQQRGGRFQNTVAGCESPKKNSCGPPLLHPDIVSGVPCPIEQNVLGNGSSSCSFRPLAVVGSSGDCGARDSKDRRDMLNNNQSQEVVGGSKEDDSKERSLLAQKDENLNISKAEINLGSGSDGDNVTETSASVSSVDPSSSNTSSTVRSSEDKSNVDEKENVDADIHVIPGTTSMDSSQS